MPAESSAPWAAVIGISSSPICGVRDHATLLAAELEQRGRRCSWHWLERGLGSLPEGRRTVASWAGGLAPAIGEEGAEVAIVHYSVFDYSHRGLPVFVRPAMSALRRTGLPVLTIVHEAVYPWDIGGARGKLWAASQRLALIDVMRTSSALLVTAEFRAEWLSSRRWLPARPISFAPVYSNLPQPREVTRAPATIGLFGYAYEGADRSLVLDALGRARSGSGQLVLRLLGAPGEDSPAGRAWRAEADARGLGGRLEFSGTLPPQELSDALARCSALLFIGAGGPSSRKGSLAGSLASGTPVLALDGPRTWQELVGSRALELVARSAPALAAAIDGVIERPEEAAALGARGRAFAEQRMGVARTGEEVLAMARLQGAARAG